MKEVCYWVADDGTKFEEEKECFNYEWRQKYQKIQNNGLKIFDRSHAEIVDWNFDVVYDVFAVLVSTLEGAKFFVEWSKDYGVEAPFSNYDIEMEDEDLLGIWVYDALDYGGWTHLDKIYKEVNELYHKFV